MTLLWTIYRVPAPQSWIFLAVFA